MYEFGEELIIESNKLPWLIWIQLLIMILIIMLLFFGFTIFSSDVSNQSSINTASSSTSRQSNVNNSTPNNINASSSQTRVEQTEIKGNATANTSTEITAETVEEREGSSSKNSISLRPFRVSEHPCHYLGLAKQAFLKCLGLDLSERTSDKQQHLKNE